MERRQHPRSPWYWDRVHLFDGVEESARDLFLRHSSRCTYRKGQTIFHEDDDASEVFYLAEGMARIYCVSPSGELTIYWYCVTGELFGAGGITGSMKQSVNGQAISSCTVYRMLRPTFEQMIKLNSQLAYNALKLMGARLRLACDTVSDMRTERTSSRVAKALLRLAHNCGVPTEQGIRLDAPITHQEVANFVGASRQTVSVILGEFEQRGFIAHSSRQIVIVEPEELYAFSDAENVA